MKLKSTQAMTLDHPTDLFFDQLRVLYSAKAQVILTLPELAARATFPDLRRLLSDHEKPSHRQKAMLLSIFERHGAPPGGEICSEVKTLIECGGERLARAGDDKVRDLLLVSHCNLIKHYEIAGFGFATSLAECLEMHREAEVLASILAQEKDLTHRLARTAADLFGPCMAAGLE